MIKILENENFAELINDGTYLVDFYANWCAPCKMIAPILEQLQNIEIIKVDIDQHIKLATKNGIMSIPTLIIFQNGEEKERIIGFRNKEELEEITKKYTN